MSRELVIIDFSSLAVPIWKMSGKEPDPDAASQKMVERVRALATGQPHVAIAMDSGKSFRNEITPTYKANRPESDAPMHHQIALAADVLKADGFPVWKVKGFEADDIIATAVLWASVQPELSVLVCSSDKDLLSLVSPTVRQKRLHDDSIYDEAKVAEVLGVTPAQMVDYISLVGDTSDNIVGAKGIGAVKASALLKNFGTLDALYVELEAKGGAAIGIKPADSENLRVFKSSGAMALARQLVTLRTDVPLPCEEILTERVATDAAYANEHGENGQCAEYFADAIRNGDTTLKPTVTITERISTTGERTVLNPPVTVPITMSQPEQPAPVSLAVREPSEVLPAPVEWERQLEPRSMREAIGLADLMFKSRLFGAYGQPAGVLSTILAGRELGLQAMASLRGFHLVDGKPTMSADLIRALVIKSGKARYFRVVERTPTIATWETQRGDDPPVSLSFTIEEAQTAGVVKAGSGWVKYPADMLTARCSAKLARLVYSDIVFNLYSPEEF